MPLSVLKKFDILAHFKFEIGSAQVSLSKLGKNLDSLSKTTKGINEQFKGLFASHAISLTGTAGGIVGTMHKMVSSSEEYYQLQRKISTIMVANTKSQMNFNTAMRTSSVIMRDLANDAQKMALPIDEYSQVFTELAGPMAAKGVAGNNFRNTRNLARNFMMMTRVFPMQPWQLQNLMAGAITNQNPLFRVLKDDTEAFKGMSLGRWRSMKYGKKVETLNRAFDQYTTQNPEIIESYSKSLSGQLVILTNSFKSLSSVLKPLGDVVKGPLLQGLVEVNKWIQEQLTVSINKIASLLKPLTRNLTGLYIEFEKLQTLSSSFISARTYGGITFLIYELIAFRKIIISVGRRFGLFSGRFAKLMTGSLIGLLKWATKTKTAFMAITVALKFLGKAMATYLAFMIPFQILFRVIDSARAQAKVKDLQKYSKELPAITEKTAEVARAFTAIQYPISSLINLLGESISFLFQKTWWLEKLYNILNKFDIEPIVKNLTKGFAMLWAVFRSFVESIGIMTAKVVMNPKKLLEPLKLFIDFQQTFLDLSKKRIGKYDLAIDKHYEKFFKEAATPPAPTYINNGPVTIRNQFPENLEPDRIAVALKDVMIKSVQAATTDKNRRQQTFVPASGYGQ